MKQRGCFVSDNKPGELDEVRFGFGENWFKFVEKDFTPQRLVAAQKKICEFLDIESLAGIRCLDIGCGSGLHSYAAYSLDATEVFSFDYDINSVKASRVLKDRAGDPPHWQVEQGDVLSDEYIRALGKWDLVYSWGVLHHTGDMWKAIDIAQQTVVDGGQFFLALYSATADFQPSKEYWLEAKKKYNRVGPVRKKLMVLHYVWRWGMQGNLKFLPGLLRRIREYRFERGMSYFADVVDWLGGWPMEYADESDTIRRMEGHGFKLIKCVTGEACSEYLFEKSSE